MCMCQLVIRIYFNYFHLQIFIWFIAQVLNSFTYVFVSTCFSFMQMYQLF